MWQYTGERGQAAFCIGNLQPEVLAELRSDPWWKEPNDLDWSEPSGTKRKQDAPSIQTETPDRTSVPEKYYNTLCKIQLICRTGPWVVEGGTCNTRSIEKDIPVDKLAQFISAFKTLNENAFEDLHTELQAFLKTLTDEELKTNGAEMKATHPKDWFAHVAFIQFVKLYQHMEKRHFDGGAACALLCITLWGKRQLKLIPHGPVYSESLPKGQRDAKMEVEVETEEIYTQSPGTVYLSCLVPVRHHVLYPKELMATLAPGVDTLFTPGLGEVGVHVIFRTPLFKAGFGQQTKNLPNPAIVWDQYTRTFREWQKKWQLQLPTLSEIRASQVLR